MRAFRDVVITGAGVVSPIGIGVDAFWNSLCAGKSGVRPISIFDPENGPASFAGEVVDFDPKALVRPRKSLKTMARETQFAVAAAELACRDARLDAQSVPRERVGLVFGADMIHCQPEELAASFQVCLDESGEFRFSRWGDRGLAATYPLWLLKYLPNMPACHVAIAQDAQGPNNSITLGDVSSLLAMAEAVRVIQRGAADAMLVGGAGSRIHPTLLVRSAVDELSRRSEPAAASRPFDADRDGMVPGEGAAVFVVEDAEHARRRGVAPLARVLAYGCAFEPPRAGAPPTGEALHRAMRLALDMACMTPGDVGHVNAHGLSTRGGDAMEAQAIRAVLGDVPVTAPKSLFGNAGAGGGALELLASLLGLRHGLVPPTLNYERPDPQCPVNIVAGSPLAGRPATALALNYAPTGQAAALMIGT